MNKSPVVLNFKCHTTYIIWHLGAIIEGWILITNSGIYMCIVERGEFENWLKNSDYSANFLVIIAISGLQLVILHKLQITTFLLNWIENLEHNEDQ